MPEIILISTIVMGLLLLAVAVAISRSGQRATPSGQAGAGSGFAEWSGRSAGEPGRVESLVKSPAVWTGGFILLALAFLAGAVLLLEGVPAIETALLETAVLAIGGTLLLGYVFFGAYYAVRDRTGQTAPALAVAATIFGILVMIAAIIAVLLA